jgi:serine protease Do
MKIFEEKNKPYIITVVACAITAVALLFIFKSTSEDPNEEHVIARVLGKVGSTVGKIFLSGYTNWRTIQNQSKDTVVQLFVQRSNFNWTQPYKTPDQSGCYGSGFFINDKGNVVTNAHVIDESIKVEIQIPSLGKERFELEKIGTSPQRDIAILKLTDESLNKISKKLGGIKFLEIGDSDTVLRTQALLTLGYPLGQEKLKSTEGIVSGREFAWGESYIQTTAAINPGNSGGPALDTNGKVIGINTATVSRAQNVGYIIPINDVKNTLQDLYKTKLLRNPIMGCKYHKGNEEMLRFLKNPPPGGVFISKVYKNSIVEKAGIQAGDMMYSINGKKIDLYGEVDVEWSEDKVSFVSILKRLKIDQEIELEIYRRGEKKTFKFPFNLMNLLPIRTVYPEYEKVDFEIIGGMVLMEFKMNHFEFFDEANPYLARYKKFENRYESKLILTQILNDSETKNSRIMKEGDLLDKVNGGKVNTLDDFRKAVKKSIEFLTVKTESRKFLVLSMKKVFEDEDKLASQNFYEKTDLAKELEKLHKRSIQETIDQKNKA